MQSRKVVELYLLSLIKTNEQKKTRGVIPKQCKKVKFVVEDLLVATMRCFEGHSSDNLSGALCCWNLHSEKSD